MIESLFGQLKLYVNVNCMNHVVQCNSTHGYSSQTSIISLGPGSLPGYPRRRMGPGGEYDDGASDISSASGFSAYGYRPGEKLQNVFIPRHCFNVK